jgi:subtilisin family serine protease
MQGNIARRNIGLAGLFALMAGLILISAPAAAVEIDKELKEILATKANDKIPVLMIYHDPVTVDDLEADLTRLSPEKRRKKVLAELKKRGRKVRANAMAILGDPLQQDQIKNLQHLYLASAFSFDASRTMIETLGGLDDNATLYHNRGFNFITGTERGAVRAEKVAVDRGDTVWSVKWIDADRVWNELGYTGSGVVVGHIDSGVYLTHPDLANQLATNAGEVPGNGVDDDGNGYVDDVNGWDFGDNDNNPNDDSADPGHGTHTAGSVVGDGTAGTHTGVAPGAKVLACKVADSAGSMTFGSVWEAQQYCVENGARVVTMSLGAPGEFPSSYMRTERAIADNMRGAGVVFFNSAANSHYEYDPPVELGLTARVPSPWVTAGTPYSQTSGVITVGGTGYRSDSMYSSSSRGPAKWDDVDPYNDWPYNPGTGLIKPDVSAPGVGVNSTVIGGGYSGETWSGTSMSCPHVAGVAALMLEKNPSLSPVGVDSLLQLTAVDLGLPGKDNDYGAGRINAYAAVQAVPLAMSADLHQTLVIPDPTGDGVLDPGEASTIAFQLQNASIVVDADNVTGTLAVVSNPYVTVSDATANFSDIPANGGLGDNAADAFGLNVAAGAPQGYEFTMLLTVSSGAYFERTFDLTWYVGLPAFRTHDKSGIYLSVTSQGSIGYMSQEGVEGDGMGLMGEGSGLFLGSFWAGTGTDYICNRDYAGVYPGVENMEWEVVTNPNGRVKDISAETDEQVYAAIFSDSGHASPKPLTVEQISYAYSDGPDNKFVILEYNLTNDGPTALNNLYTGVFCDFDVANSGANEGGTNSALNLSYINAGAGTGPYFGIALLGDADTATNLTMINNPTYVYDTSSISDSFKMRHLRGLISLPATSGPDDWSALTSKMVNLDAGGGTATVAYAMVVGETLADLEANVAAANEAYNPVADVPGEEMPRQLVRLAQNHPNPFNPSTRIAFSVADPGHVELGVYDLSGRLVRTLVSGQRGVGDYHVTWDGRNAEGGRAPSGLYFYRLQTGGQTISRKMTLVK